MGTSTQFRRPAASTGNAVATPKAVATRAAAAIRRRLADWNRLVIITLVLPWSWMRIAVDASDGDQRGAQVADPLEQAVERRLVGDRTGDDRRPVVLDAERQPLEPRRPVGAQRPDDPDLVPRGVRAVAGRHASLG